VRVVIADDSVLVHEGIAALLTRAGVLESDAGGAVDTEAAILDDPALSGPQRVALLSIYRSFVPPGRRGSLDK